MLFDLVFVESFSLPLLKPNRELQNILQMTQVVSYSLYIYIYIYCHPLTDYFVVSQSFSVARHTRILKLGSKPG